MQISFRELTLSDVFAIVEAEHACFALPWQEKDVLSVCKRIDFCGVVAEVGGEIVGYLLGLTLFENAEVLRLGTLPAYRGKGVGGAVLDAFFERVKARGAERVFLEVRVSNLPAIRLYERKYFVRGRVRENYYENGESAVEMCKDL